jgi:murein DD-endopeptidase MepM/ murein hydrolase activator NlpD
MNKIKKLSFGFGIKFLVLVGVFSVIFGFNLGISNKVLAQENTSSQNKNLELDYLKQREEIQSKIEVIKKNLDQISSSQNELQKQKNNLNDQSNTIQKEKSDVDNMITDTKLVIGQVEKQIKDNQTEIDKVNQDIKETLREIQKTEKISPLKIIFSSTDLGSAMTEIYSISTVNDRLESSKIKLATANKKLEDNKKQNTQIREQLERSRGLLKSRESSLDALIAKTDGENKNYQKLLESIKEQKSTLEGQLGGIKGEYLAELQTLREGEIQKNNLRNSVNTSCSFEESQTLDVPTNFFGKPTSGWISQNFHCGHDGVDVANNMGTTIQSIGDGKVVRKGERADNCVGITCNGGFGNFVLIQHDLPSNQKVYSLYAHMQRVSAKSLGDSVKKGEEIGLMGCTGYTLPYPCGVHLHFMIYSESYEKSGLGCRLGGSKCYNPQKYIQF